MQQQPPAAIDKRRKLADSCILLANRDELVKNSEFAPLKPELRIHQIVDVAIQILDDGGVDALTMRGLAAQLHLRPMALYYYVPNKSEIL